MSSLDREISRRKFLKVSAGAVAVGAVSATLGCKEVVGELKSGRSFEKLENTPETLMVTQKFGNYNILLRSDANLSEDSIVGMTKPGFALIVSEGRGVTYPDSDFNEGIVEYKGEKRGVWYIANEVPLYEDVGGELFAKNDELGNQIVVKNAIIAGNFLRKPTDEEIERIIDTASGNK